MFEIDFLINEAPKYFFFKFYIFMILSKDMYKFILFYFILNSYYVWNFVIMIKWHFNLQV
jgi:hypothetical protein